jgi:hypothetical protein
MRKVLKVGELREVMVRRIRASNMGARHNHLNSLVTYPAETLPKPNEGDEVEIIIVEPDHQ